MSSAPATAKAQAALVRRWVLAAALALLASPAAQADGSRVVFDAVPPSESGITWIHDNAMSPERHLPETTGAGVAFFDYDNDGWQDLYLVNSGRAGFFTPRKPLRNALYRNQGDGTFADVTENAGVAGGRFGMGAAAADYDGDGWVDLYVTNYGPDILYRNNGDGTFRDVTTESAISAPGWSTSAVWFDYDNDAQLDLYVAVYALYTADESRFCGDRALQRQHYCKPQVFQPAQSRLFHNEGGGKFRDVSQETGIAIDGKALGVGATDINNDGWQDLFVANDTMANFLFLNLADGTFEEIALLAGVAYSADGNPRSGMGVDAADYDSDGWQDLFVANIDQQMFSLYRNTGDLEFKDASAEIRRETRLLSGWGLRFFDYDNDSDPDLILANGHPDDQIHFTSPVIRYRMRLRLFENLGDDYKHVSSQSGAVFTKDYPARGLATGDYDNDGDLDVVISNSGEAPLLLRNNGGNRNNWVGLQLVATKSNPAAVGAQISWRASGIERSRWKTGGGSYLSSHDPREILGLGEASEVEEIEIRWPSGTVDRLRGVSANQYLTIVEGEGAIAE